MTRPRRCRLFAFGVAVLATAVVRAQTTQPAASHVAPDERTFTVTPAPPPVPALRYRFEFDRSEQIEGNAATAHLQAMLMMPDAKSTEDLYDFYADTQSDAQYVTGLKERWPWLDTKVPTLLATAVRCERCVWDFPARHDGINTLLPYLNHMRETANQLAYRARLATATGDWKQTIELLRTINVLAEHCQHGDTDTFLVNTLVAVGIEAIGVQELQRLMDRPDSPNLYWALRQLPVPFGNLRGAFYDERSSWELTYPAWQKADRGEELSPAEWRALLRALTQDLASFESEKAGLPTVTTDADLLDLVRGDLPAAREEYARRHNLAPAAVEALDPVLVVASVYFDDNRTASDDFWKWAVLPYPQALPGMAAAIERAQALRRAQPNNLFLRAGGILRSRTLSCARLDRRLAACATVEALRAYAAAHSGQLPATLTDITETPPPMNPVTGRPFDYAVEGGAAILSDPGQWLDQPLRYEVRLRQ